LPGIGRGLIDLASGVVHMTRWPRCLPTLVFLGLLTAGHLLADAPKAEFDLSDYRTVDTAVTAKVSRPTLTTSSLPAYLGVNLDSDTQKRLVVAQVTPDSPAARAGIQPGDLLLKLDGKDVTEEAAFHDLLRAKSPGDRVQLSLSRQDKPLNVSAALVPLSRPMTAGRTRAGLGVQVTGTGSDGVAIEQVFPGSPAEKAKLKPGEIILKINETLLTGADSLREALAGKQPEEVVTLTLLLAEKTVLLKVKLGVEQISEGRQGGWDTRGGRYVTGSAYRLAIICVEYPDVKHNPKIPAKAWEESMFSRGKYTQTSATGQPVYGSLYDYYLEQSYGHLKIEGKAFDYVEVSKKRAEYATGNRMALLTEALDKLLAREGKDALKEFDGVFYVYAGDRYPAARGSLYWPHRATVNHNGKRWPYFICPEGGERMGNISVFCHEFGHMLGLPDLYARPENPGSEGLGIWCAMSNQAGNGRPQHFSAWCKEKLGWAKPTVLDPTVKQKLILAPIEDSPKECFKVLLKPDASEYLLLENRAKKGFDTSLPAYGLLIWRVVGNRPILEESHGIEGPAGPRSFLNLVPYPSESNDSFTPYTIPSSRSQLGGGLPVYITNIRRLADGRVTFHIGYEYQ
jgi:M6 family metalloprotease-like protein